MEEKRFRKVFRDITRGFSNTFFRGKEVFIKHMTTHDQVDLEDVYDKYYKDAESRGIPKEKDMTDFLIEEGLWKREDEDELDRTLDYIKRLEDSKKHLLLKKEIDKKNKEIKSEQAKYYEKVAQKDDMLGGTCEKYARERTNDYYVVKSFFKDESLKERFFSEEEYGEMFASEVREISHVYNTLLESFTEQNIKNLVVQEFYYPYFPFSEDVMQFFGVPAVKLTRYQINLIIYTRVIKNVLERHDNIPEEVRKDPDKLMDYSNISEKAKEKLSKHEGKAGASTVFGADKEDYEYMDINSVKKEGSVSLREEAVKKGGRLSMEDMMRLSGA